MSILQFLCAAVGFVALALAQSTPIAFTSVPAVVQAGETYNISWGKFKSTMRHVADDHLRDAASCPVPNRSLQPHDLNAIYYKEDTNFGHEQVVVMAHHQ